MRMVCMSICDRLSVGSSIIVHSRLLFNKLILRYTISFIQRMFAFIM